MFERAGAGVPVRQPRDALWTDLCWYDWGPLGICERIAEEQATSHGYVLFQLLPKGVAELK